MGPIPFGAGPLRLSAGLLTRGAGFLGFGAGLLALAGASFAFDEYVDGPVAQCLSCHVDESGRLDIVGVRALAALPPEWQFLYEDGFDLDGDGIAGRMRFVPGEGGPKSAKFGKALAAARFEDFALIAAAAHGIDLSAPGTMAALKSEFEARSPEPTPADAHTIDLSDFEARGCARCHVTRTFEFAGQTYMPLSDFLLHDLGDGEGFQRTAPLWGCPECLRAAPHPVPQ